MTTPDVITPSQLIAKHSEDLSSVLPSHVHAPVWIRVAQGAVRRDPKLMKAATETPASLMVALLNAARLGLEPGTEEFYLTPRKVKGKMEVLGITGYQGIVEMMYRAGAVSSVVAECVYDSDGFDYQPGRDELPMHRIDWDSNDRGELRLVYAYARLRSGATSKVIVLNRAEINKIKASSMGSDGDYSPWRTNEAAMWLKSAVRQLRKWVPTSAEFRDQLRVDAQGIARVQAEVAAGRPRAVVLNTETGEIEDSDLDAIDAEIVDPADPWLTGERTDDPEADQ
ncbi:recombinase RecT [Nocardioides terrisoli]|uniref:recombinase RecT n=1 Tax=Nocardioides terrisoli TaxID=3388267 RepID=UPI00287B6F92|nr:recombinase RecT [Nocardioides marmorisolisilvae]HWU20932.1 recombinase RecT [Nocardioides sp.]